MGWLRFVRELNDFIFGLSVSENETGKCEDCKMKMSFEIMVWQQEDGNLWIDCMLRMSSNGKIGMWEVLFSINGGMDRI